MGHADWDPAIVIALLQIHHFGLVFLSLSALVLGPSKMLTATCFISYKQVNYHKKVLSSGSNIKIDYF